MRIFNLYKALIGAMLAAIVFYCCHPPEQPAGGPCSYRDTRIGATVLAIDSVGEESRDLQLKLDSNNFYMPPDDTTYYHLHNNTYITRTLADSLQIAVGKKYNFVISEIVSGSCNPLVTWVELTPYVPTTEVADSIAH
jgi:hypothetical protein